MYRQVKNSYSGSRLTEREYINEEINLEYQNIICVESDRGRKRKRRRG
jgi:hypothetical protein